MPVRQVAHEDKRERNRFVALEYELLAGEPLFVPEIAADVDKRLRGRSPFYGEMTHSLLPGPEAAHTGGCDAALRTLESQEQRVLQ